MRVTFTDDAGNPESLTSVATAAVAARPNTPATGQPTIGGTAQVGETLTADTSDIDDADGLENATFAYQWVREGGTTETEIQGATTFTYTLADADEGKTIKVRVSFTDDAGNEETLTSAATDAVEAAPTEEEAAQTEGGICGRTEQVRGEILDRLPRITDCALVTDPDLGSITRLALWHEDITELQSGDFQGLSNLKKLDLDNNDLSELPADIFSGLSNLKTLDLRGNELTELLEGVFSGLSNLEELDLFSNELTGLPEGVFSGLSNLEELDLYNNNLSELPLSIFDGLDNLKRLDLRVNPGTPFWYTGKELEYRSGFRYTELHGDTPETATPLPYGPYGPSITGRIYPVTDVDYFKVEVTESNKGYSGFPLVSKPGVSKPGASKVHHHAYALFDSEGNCVGRKCELTAGIQGSGTYNLEPGTYYLRVITPEIVDGFFDNFPDALEDNAYYQVSWMPSRLRDLIDRCSAIEHDFDDPLYGCQSEFHDRDGDAEDINVEPVWAEGNLGEGIIVGIVDKGIDYEHEDLRDNFDMARSHAYHGDGRIFSPNYDHGTVVAGILAARDNSVGGRGVAPRATIYSYTVGFIGSSWNGYTKGATHQLRDTAVSNHSAVPVSRYGYPTRYFHDWDEAVKKGITQGFHGKGTSYVIGAGNGRADANLSQAGNFHGVINVCGIAYDGSPIHSYGSNVWICAPVHVLTTYNFDLYYRTRGGGHLIRRPGGIGRRRAGPEREPQPDLARREADSGGLRTPDVPRRPGLGGRSPPLRVHQ